MQNAAAWIMYEWFGGKRAGGMDGWSDGKVRGLGGWQLTCQRAHHISSQPNETKRNAPLLPTNQTTHFAVYAHQGKQTAKYLYAKPNTCERRSPTMPRPPLPSRPPFQRVSPTRLKYFALLSRNYKSGQLLKICSPHN